MNGIKNTLQNCFGILNRAHPEKVREHSNRNIRTKECDDFCIWVLIMEAYIGLVGRVFANGSGNLGSILGRVIPKTLTIVLDTSLLNTQRYKVRIKGKIE